MDTIREWLWFGQFRTKVQLLLLKRQKSDTRKIWSSLVRRKIKTISLGEAISNYLKQESARVNRGMIESTTFDKKSEWLNNHFMRHFGESLVVNNISDKAMEEFIDIRMNRCKRKTTIRQKYPYIKHFYRTYLIKNGWVFGMPEFPEFKIRKSDRRKKWHLQTRRGTCINSFYVEWMDRSSRIQQIWFLSRQKVTVKAYGKKDNVVKRQREDQFRLEMHRRTMMF